MLIYEIDKKSKTTLMIASGIFTWLFIMVFATIIYILQWNYLTPEVGSTFEKDMVKATLCYIFIPLGFSLIISLGIYLYYRKLNIKVEFIDNHFLITSKKGNNEQLFEFNKKDIIEVKSSKLLWIFDLTDLSVKVKEYIHNGKLIQNEQKFAIIHICKRKELKEKRELFDIVN